jgi:hypothetical protein
MKWKEELIIWDLKRRVKRNIRQRHGEIWKKDLLKVHIYWGWDIKLKAIKSCPARFGNGITIGDAILEKRNKKNHLYLVKFLYNRGGYISLKVEEI